MADDKRDGHKITWAQQIFGRDAAIPRHNPLESKANDTVEPQGAPAPARVSPSGESSALAVGEASEGEAHQKQFKTAAELARMIEFDLARHPDCPRAGFRVTVYGWPYWRAMLTITPAAGGIRNPQEWRDLTSDLAERLRKRYDLAWEE